MFTYLDADERRPSLAALMELYWRTMPAYQVLSARQRACLDAAAVFAGAGQALSLMFVLSCNLP